MEETKDRDKKGRKEVDGSCAAEESKTDDHVENNEEAILKGIGEK